MTTEQIIKGMKCCGEQRLCSKCPYADGQDKVSCRITLRDDVFALVSNQLAEIRGLNSAIETLQGVAKDYEHRNENLINENKYLRERIAEEMGHAKDVLNKSQ